jgi:hypothetical protein
MGKWMYRGLGPEWAGRAIEKIYENGHEIL